MFFCSERHREHSKHYIQIMSKFREHFKNCSQEQFYKIETKQARRFSMCSWLTNQIISLNGFLINNIVAAGGGVVDLGGSTIELK